MCATRVRNEVIRVCQQTLCAEFELGDSIHLFHYTRLTLKEKVFAKNSSTESPISLALRPMTHILPVEMQTRIENTIKRHQLLEHGQSVLIGLSGGPDSVALLHVLHDLAKRWRLNLEAVYINHGLRPRQARREERFCQEQCDRLGVALHIVRQDISQLSGSPTTGLEEAGRRFRYGVWETIAEAEGLDRIALGHHAGDRVETILLNMFRGSGRGGLVGMPIRRDRIIRPLFECDKGEILSFLESREIAFCTDSSNRDCRFRRNFIRNRLLPMLRDRVNPGVDLALLSASEILAEEEQHLRSVFDRAADRAIATTPGGKIELALDTFHTYDKWLRSRLLRHCVTMASGELAADRKVTERLLGWIASAKRSISLPGKVQVERIDRKLVFFRKQTACFETTLSRGNWVPIDMPAMRLRWSRPRTKPCDRDLRGSRHRVWLDADRVVLPMTVRNYRPGDRFRLLGLAGAKKVARYLMDKKVPRVYRDEVPVVCDQEGIVWLVGYEIADRVKISQSTREVIKIECAKPKQAQVPAV